MSNERAVNSDSRSSQVVTLVIGIGNSLRGDDGIGPRVIEELTRRGLPGNVKALDAGTGGLSLLDDLEGYRRVVVVDAADVGLEPGQFARFAPQEVRLVETMEDRFSLHHAGLREVLALAEALGRSLPPMVIFGMQPAQIGWQDGLSPAVAAALPTLVEAIQREVGEDHAQDSDH